jgi:hypothetical protein
LGKELFCVIKFDLFLSRAVVVGGKAKGNKEPEGSEDDSHEIKTSKSESSTFRSSEKGPFSGGRSRLGVRESANFIDGEIGVEGGGSDGAKLGKVYRAIFAEGMIWQVNEFDSSHYELGVV